MSKTRTRVDPRRRELDAIVARIVRFMARETDTENVKVRELLFDATKRISEAGDCFGGAGGKPEDAT